MLIKCIIVMKINGLLPMLLTNTRLFGLLIVFIGLSACGMNPVKSNLSLDLSQPGSIEIDIESENPDLDAGAIKNQIGKNLAYWHYPMTPAAKAPISHRMIATIGKPEHGSTPTGFSFSIGNSDPRALDFQKADVLSITCKLEAAQHSTQSAELNMGFADSAVTGSQPDMNDLTDHVSTVCFNLLQEINWPLPKTTDTAAATTPSWIPEIRIETESESEIFPKASATPSEATTTLPSEAPAKSSKGIAESPVDAQIQPSLSPLSEPAEKPKTVAKEITKEGRKVYIIHNQGNPIIFKFGFERR